MNRLLLKDLCIKSECGKYGIPASAEEYSETKTRYLRISDISPDGKRPERRGYDMKKFGKMAEIIK